MIGKGDGTFLPQEVFPVGDKPYSVAVADVNGDGRPDIIVANSASDTRQRAHEPGRDERPRQLRAADDVRHRPQPVAVAVGDLTGDGMPDIVTANAYDSTVSVLMGNGNGTFQPQQTFAVGSRPYSVALADLTGDGRLDIVTTNYGSNSVSVLLNNGDGTFGNQQTFATASPVQTVVADVNGDGLPDLVTINNHDSTIGVLLGKGDGTFEPAPAGSGVGLNDTPFLAISTATASPTPSSSTSRATSSFARGCPARRRLRPARDPQPRPAGARHHGPADRLSVRHRGRRRPLRPHSARPVISSSRSRSTRSAPNGAGHSRTAFATTDLPTSLAAAHLTGNGLFDLIAANALDNSVTIAFQTSPGVFAAPLTVPAGIAPSAITTGRLQRRRAARHHRHRPGLGRSDRPAQRSHAHFSQSLQFRASTSLYGLSPASGGPGRQLIRPVGQPGRGRFHRRRQRRSRGPRSGTHSFTVLAATATAASPTRSSA